MKEGYKGILLETYVASLLKRTCYLNADFCGRKGGHRYKHGGRGYETVGVRAQAVRCMRGAPGVGFEPTRAGAHRISSPAPWTSRPPRPFIYVCNTVKRVETLEEHLRRVYERAKEFLEHPLTDLIYYKMGRLAPSFMTDPGLGERAIEGFLEELRRGNVEALELKEREEYDVGNELKVKRWGDRFVIYGPGGYTEEFIDPGHTLVFGRGGFWKYSHEKDKAEVQPLPHFNREEIHPLHFVIIRERDGRVFLIRRKR